MFIIIKIKINAENQFKIAFYVKLKNIKLNDFN